MALISEEYREQNRKLHAKDANYGSKGYKNAKAAIRLSSEYNGKTVLDYGCGKRGLEFGLRNTELIVRNYDPATEYNEDPQPSDIVVCADVLEHIEPECLDEVLNHITSKIIKVGYFIISCRPALNHLPDGRNTHLMVMEPIWWLHKVKEYLDVVWSKVNPDEKELILLVEPKEKTNGDHATH